MKTLFSPLASTSTYCFFLLINLTVGINAFAQDLPNDFLIALPSQKVKNSAYSKIDFTDSRSEADKARNSYGIIKIGAWPKPVITSTPLQRQLENIVDTLTDATAKDGWLLFQLRQFFFGRLSRTSTDRGYYYLKATLFARNDSGLYQRLDSLDTTIVVKSGNLNPALYKSAGNTFSNFISKNLINVSPDTVLYSYTDVMYIEEIEKKRMPLYTAETLAEGAYLTYKSFAKQVPDKQVKVEMKDDKIKSVTWQDERGDEVKMKWKNVYALVYQGHPYIATETGFFPLRKTENDFFFTGTLKIKPTNSDYFVTGMLFGALVVLMMSEDEAEYEFKINHLDGSLIAIREISKR